MADTPTPNAVPPADANCRDCAHSKKIGGKWYCYRYPPPMWQMEFVLPVHTLIEPHDKACGEFTPKS